MIVSIGADLGGAAQGLRHPVRHHDQGCSGPPRGDDEHRADRPATGHQHRLAEQRAGAIDGMEGDGERLRHRALAVAHALGQAKRLAGVDDDLLAERALHMRHPHGAAVVAHVEAMVLQAELAVATAAAGPARADGDALAGRVVAHRSARLLDHARHLMAEDHGLLDPHRTEAAMLEVVQVGAADAAGAHAHPELLGPDLRRLDVLDAEIAGGVNHECIHGSARSEKGDALADRIEDAGPVSPRPPRGRPSARAP